MGFYTNVGRGVWALSRASGRAGQRASQRLVEVIDARSARHGVLGPGAPPPPPEFVGDFLDYRGAASPRDLGVLLAGDFPLGRTVRYAPRDRPVPLYAPLSMVARHAVLLGPAGSGKTEGVMIPWIVAALGAGHTVVATDVKGDLLERLRRYSALTPAGPRTRVRVWDPDAPPGGSTSWNWISTVTTDAEIDAAIVGLIGRSDKAHRADLWNIDYEITKGLLLYAKALLRRPITAGDLRACLDPVEIEHNLDGNARHPGHAELWPYVAMSRSDFAKATSGIRPVLAALATPPIERVTREPRLDLDEVLSSPGLFIIGARLAGGATAEKLSALALGVVQQRLYARLARAHHDGRVLVMIDEAGPLLSRFDLPRALTTVRSADVSYVFGLQAVEMIADEDERNTVLANTGVTVALRGMSDGTAEHLSRRFGMRNERSVSAGRSMTSADRSRQVTHQQVPAIGTRELQWPPFSDHAAVVSLVGDRRLPAKPIFVDLTRDDLL